MVSRNRNGTRIIGAGSAPGAGRHRRTYRRGCTALPQGLQLPVRIEREDFPGQTLMQAPQSTHSLSFRLMPCSRIRTSAPRLVMESRTSRHWSSGTSISASPSDESITARSTLIRTPVSRTTCAMIGFLPLSTREVDEQFHFSHLPPRSLPEVHGGEEGDHVVLRIYDR